MIGMNLAAFGFPSTGRRAQATSATTEAIEIQTKGTGF
jgi:hypothetical protein